MNFINFIEEVKEAVVSKKSLKRTTRTAEEICLEELNKDVIAE